MKQLFSQSLYKELLNPDTCPLYIKFKYIDCIERTPSDVMVRGQYFEHHLIGSTRNGNIPELPRLKMGGPTQAQKDLDALIPEAKSLLSRLGILSDPPEHSLIVQPEIIVDDEVAHPDFIGHDFQEPKRRALYDVKYTETALDDRWNGWADFDTTRQGDKFQAVHYTKLYFEKYGFWVPFYFLVFGKSGWVRILKVEITELGMDIYTNDVARAREVYKRHTKNKWSAMPLYNKCNACPYNSICPAAATLPEVETFQI